MNDAMIEIRGKFNGIPADRYERNCIRFEDILGISEGDGKNCFLAIYNKSVTAGVFKLDETYDSFVERYSKARYCARLFECGGEAK